MNVDAGEMVGEDKENPIVVAGGKRRGEGGSVGDGSDLNDGPVNYRAGESSAKEKGGHFGGSRVEVSRNSDRVPLILTYHPTSIHIQNIIRCYFRHLQRDATTRHTFLSPPLSAFRRDRSLWDILVHTSFTPNTSPQPYGTFPCNRQRCNT
eukprot:g13142.t1